MKYNHIRLVFDIDGTLCPLKQPDETYENLIPDQSMIEKLRFYKQQGATIILASSRNMRTYNNNLGLINANTAVILHEWLQKWQIPYDEIYFGKPWPGPHGLYIDDRAVRPDEFLSHSFEELEQLCQKSTRKPQ
ncbi:MAG: HAD hydrolase family protein [Candidatus Saccharibacteria bacterium]|nr:HAD hydrolase family protein [Candidatus Saccharibacteria bacterium]